MSNAVSFHKEMKMFLFFFSVCRLSAHNLTYSYKGQGWRSYFNIYFLLYRFDLQTNVIYDEQITVMIWIEYITVRQNFLMRCITCLVSVIEKRTQLLSLPSNNSKKSLIIEWKMFCQKMLARSNSFNYILPQHVNVFLSKLT